MTGYQIVTRLSQPQSSWPVRRVALYIDQALPEVWDFSQDVVVLCDAVDKLYADLLLEHKRSLSFWLNRSAGVLASESASDSDPRQFFPPGSSPDSDIFSRC